MESNNSDYQKQPKSVVDIFKNSIRGYIEYVNNSDCFAFPSIPDRIKVKARRNFGINQQDTLLLIRDSGFWNNIDQGIVVTDSGLYGVNDNDDKENSSWFLGWGKIDSVRYQELSIIIKFDSGEELDIEINRFLKVTDGEAKKCGGRFAWLLDRMAKAVEPEDSPLISLAKQIDELDNQEKYREAADLLLSNLYSDFGDGQWKIYSWLSDEFDNLEDDSNAFHYAKEGLKYCDEGSPAYVELSYFIYSAAEYLKDLKNARAYAMEDIVYATDETYLGGSIKENATTDFVKYEKEYTDSFLTLPYNQRKILMPVKDYVSLKQDALSVIRIDNLPTEIAFPMGHPISEHVYVGHPLLPHRYIPIEDYQRELVEDKVREFCEIAQCLGATEIVIDCLNTNSSNQTANNKKNTAHNVDVTIANGNVQRNTEASRKLIDELSHSISMRQTFSPSKKPYLPENLIWYNNEPSWQRLYNQRMQGSISSHEERIETKKSQMVESRELKTVKGEVEYLYAKLNLELDKSDEQQFEQQENATISIKIKFAPINQLNGETPNMPAQPSNTFTSEEQEYLEEYKECLADGEIGAGERRLLDKLRTKLGISSERAGELEASLQPQLTDEEKEYLNEYKAVAVAGVITDKERRLLEKLRKMLDISEDRANVIEHING